MLFPPHSVAVQCEQILRELDRGEITEAVAGERILAVDPGFAGAYIFLGNARKDAGELDQAESLFWKVVEGRPCDSVGYLAMTEARRRHPDDALGKHLWILALWKLAMAQKIPEPVADRFKASMPKAEVDFHDPATFEILACGVEQQVEEAAAGIPERLKLYYLLNDLQREAPDGLDSETLAAILDNPAGCAPIWRAALRDWARRPAALTADALACLIATLGEISGPEVLDDLLELITYGDWTISLHAQWAIWRIGQRFPAETLASVHAASGSASVTARCGLAEQIALLPAQTNGVEKALMALLDGFTRFAREDDAAFLLLAVTEALRRHGRKREARDVLQRYEEVLGKKGRRWLRQVLESDDGFVPHLDAAGISELSIEDVCIERALMGDDVEDEDDEDDEDDEEQPGPPAVRPGRNDPCWCGSGKKYKKCHLDSDEQGGKDVSDEPDVDPVVGTIFGDILENAPNWHNRADLHLAYQLFFERDPDDVGESEMTESGFLSWYVLDFRSPSTGRTLVEEYLRRRGPRLSERARALLESWRTVRYGFWEAQRVEPGQGLELKNLFDGETMFVHDVLGSRSIMQGDCEAARLHHFEGQWLYAGDGLILPPAVVAPLTRMVEEASSAAGQSPAEYVRVNSHLWERMLEQLHRELPRDRRIVNAEGDVFEFCSAAYELSDTPAAVAALRAARMFEETTSPDDPPGSLSFGWLEVGSDGPRRSYGHIAIEHGALRLECNSRKRLGIGRQLVEKHAGAYLRHLGDNFTPVEDAMKKTADSRGAEELPPAGDREV